MNWKHDQFGTARYLPMLWAMKSGAHFDAAFAKAETYPHRTWLLGNEPEREDQSDTDPIEFAARMEEWSASTGGPSFIVAPNILWDDQGRDWLARYLAVPGRIIPGTWGIHIYGSSTGAGWQDQMNHAQQWFQARGVSRAIWVTETNAQGDYNAQVSVMRHIDAYVGSLIFWYASRDPFNHAPNANLVNEAGTALTQLGAEFARLQAV